MIAPGTCGGPGSWFGNFSGGFIKIRGLWVYEVFMMPISRGFRVFWALNYDFEYICDYLWEFDYLSTGGFKAYNSLFVSCSYGISDFRVI